MYPIFEEQLKTQLNCGMPGHLFPSHWITTFVLCFLTHFVDLKLWSWHVWWIMRSPQLTLISLPSFVVFWALGLYLYDPGAQWFLSSYITLSLEWFFLSFLHLFVNPCFGNQALVLIHNREELNVKENRLNLSSALQIILKNNKTKWGTWD